jgi:hypothetical protein
LLSPLSAGTAVFTYSSNNIILGEGKAYFPYVTMWDDNIQNMSENDGLKANTHELQCLDHSVHKALFRVIPHNTLCSYSTSQKLKPTKCTLFRDKPPSAPWGYHQGVSSNYKTTYIFIDICSVVSSHTSLCNYQKLFDNGPGGLGHVGHLLGVSP